VNTPQPRLLLRAMLETPRAVAAPTAARRWMPHDSNSQ
jgi:hypothetical protein